MNEYINFLNSEEYTRYNSFTEDDAVNCQFNFVNKLFPIDDKIVSPDNIFPLNIAELRISSDLEFIQNKMKISLRKILQHFHVRTKGNSMEYIKYFKPGAKMFCRIITSLVYHNLISIAITLTFRLSRYRNALGLVQETSFCCWEVAYLKAITKLKEYGIEHEEPEIV